MVTKRDGRTEPFNIDKITSAVTRCAMQHDLSRADATVIAKAVATQATNILRDAPSPTVEDVQDTVEHQLMAGGHFALAKSYILYRNEHARHRDDAPISPEDAEYVRSTKAYFPTESQAFQYMDKYARYNTALRRRETWPESVDRVIHFFQTQAPNAPAIGAGDWGFLRNSMLEMRAMPSMRVLQMAGPALERCHVGAYNCAFRAINDIEAFDEILYVLMQGTGAGFSVETEHVDRLPRVRRQRKLAPVPMTIEDSTVGWCNAMRSSMEKWFDGYDVALDYSHIRAAGAPLKTKGGRASGPEPLRQLLNFARARVLANQGGRLHTLDAHDIACFAGKIVEVGGVRRAALASLSDLDDDDMREAKLGDLRDQEQRYQSNNSAVYSEQPTDIEFMSEWLSLAKSGNGERGIFNRDGLLKHMPKRRKRYSLMGTNPCFEILLRNKQFCNLSIAIAREHDTKEDLDQKVLAATIFGTLQSTLTNFQYLSSDWKANCEEERLLGVDITGQMDCHLLSADVPGRDDHIASMRDFAIATNKEYSALLQIPQSVAVTCVKPSGNSAQLFGCSSGLHPRYAPYYIRRFKVGALTPILQMLKDQGAPVVQRGEGDFLIEFPVKSPDDAVTRNDLTAIEQLNNWLSWKTSFTEHNPSITVYIEPQEWVEVGAWVKKNWDRVGGVSFLPKDGGTYTLAPYEEITKEDYERRLAAFTPIDYSKLPRYEKFDTTTVHQELACVGDVCERD